MNMKPLSVFAAVLLLVSLLNIVETESYRLWQLTVAAREYGHWFALIGVAAMIRLYRTWNLRTINSRRFTLFCLLGATLLFSRPVYEAKVNDAGLAAQVASLSDQGMNFSGIEKPESLFSISKLLWLDGERANAFEKVEFTSAQGANLHFDFYRAKVSPAPLVVVVHGGGWDGGNTQQLPSLNQDLVNAGYAVASVSYRFTPATQWPGQLEDVNAALDELTKRQTEFGFDPRRIALLGRSAGAQIAGIVAYTRKDLNIRGVINFYGPTDLKFGYEVAKDNDILDSRNLLKKFLGGVPNEMPESYRSSSMIASAEQRPVPTLLLFGEDDLIVWFKHGERLKYELEARKIPVAFLSLPWGVHGFDFNPRGPGGQISRNSVLHFLRAAFIASN